MTHNNHHNHSITLQSIKNNSGYNSIITLKFIFRDSRFPYCEQSGLENNEYRVTQNNHHNHSITLQFIKNNSGYNSIITLKFIFRDSRFPYREQSGLGNNEYRLTHNNHHNHSITLQSIKNYSGYNSKNSYFGTRDFHIANNLV